MDRMETFDGDEKSQAVIDSSINDGHHNGFEKDDRSASPPTGNESTTEGTVQDRNGATEPLALSSSGHNSSTNSNAEDIHADEDSSNNIDINNDNDDNDNDSDSEDWASDNSELIRLASAAAVADAVAMKRSDSALSEEDEDDPFEDDQRNASDGTHGRNLSVAYMEHASYEAEMTNNNQHRLHPSGSLGRKRISSSREDVHINLNDSNISDAAVDDIFDSERSNEMEGHRPNNRRKSSVGHFQSLSRTKLPTVIAQDAHSIKANDHKGRENEQQDSHSKDDTSLDLQYLAKKFDIDLSAGSSDTYSEDVRFLYSIFNGFCQPPLHLDKVKQIVDFEQGRSDIPVDLPAVVTIQKLSPILLELLDGAYLKISRVIALSFFRILLRILTGDSDDEYNVATLRSCSWYDEMFEKKAKSGATIGRRASVDTLCQRINESYYANLMHCVVRFRMQWKDAVRKTLHVIETMDDNNEQHKLLEQVVSLLGVMTAGGIAADDLRRMISLASDQQTSAATKLLMVRALSLAASMTAKSPTQVVGRINPTQFFSFVMKSGISRTINLEKTSWPFRNDFGTAFDFRAENCTDTSPSVLLAAIDDEGNGIEISLISLQSETKTGDHSNASVLAISMLEESKVVRCIRVNNCPLHARVWYHVAVRHTRARLKGVFSLSSREQLTVMIDGKTVLSESLKFPQIHDNPDSKALILKFGQFEGQAGALHIFHDNVSDATLKAMFEMKTDTNEGGKLVKDLNAWDERHENVARKVMELQHVRADDLIDVALCHRSIDNSTKTYVADLFDEEGSSENNPLSKAAFNSKLYLVWEPSRNFGNALIAEVHSGAHVDLMDCELVATCDIEGAQQVIGGVGGVQALIPILNSLLHDVESSQIFTVDLECATSEEVKRIFVLFSLVPDLLNLLSSFVCGHKENAREILRCGVLDVLEKGLFGAMLADCRLSPIQALSAFPSLANVFISSLLGFQSSCRHYVGLDIAVFSRLLMNVQLWFIGFFDGHGVALVMALLPVLGSIVRESPAKVRDCVTASYAISLLHDLVEMQSQEKQEGMEDIFRRGSTCIVQLQSWPTTEERHHVIDVLLSWVFQIFQTGPSVDDLASYLQLLSKYLDFEFDEATTYIAKGSIGPARSFLRQERYSFTLKACEVLLLLLSSRPPSPTLIANFARACGGVESGAAWIMSAVVNSYCDKLQGIGIKCIIEYIRATGTSQDQALEIKSQSTRTSQADPRIAGQENTMSLIANVGQGLLAVNVGKGIAAIGPAVRSLLPSAKLTPAVVFKFLFFLVKRHRYRIGQYTHAGLVSMAFEKKKDDMVLSRDSLINNFLTKERLNFTWADSVFVDGSVDPNTVSVGSSLRIGTLLRLLRFLPEEYLDRWLSDIVDVVKTSEDATAAISACPDWQPCLFQLLSEFVEKIASTTVTANLRDLSLVDGESAPDPQGFNGKRILLKRFDHCLELYSILLGHLVRVGGEKSVMAVEEAAALQRVYVNGPEALALVFSYLLSNLSSYGIMPLDKVTSTGKSDLVSVETSDLLKHTAKTVTDTILANGTSSAVDSWRMLRLLTTVVLAFTLNYKKEEGLLCAEEGIVLPEGHIGSFSLDDLSKCFRKEDISKQHNRVSAPARDPLRVHLAEQVLSLLDVFVFPDAPSLDSSTSTTQLHGLALVRGSEPRIGQFPLLVLLVRASLILLGALETCSVKMLQCCSRLRCFVHYTLQLIRETQIMEGYTSTFSSLSLPFDRLLIGVVIECHSTLGRCATLMEKIETTPVELLFPDKEVRKKCYRRLLRATIELREILMTIDDSRKMLLQDFLTHAAFETLQNSLSTRNSNSGAQYSSQKEASVRAFLDCDFVLKFATSDNYKLQHVKTDPLLKEGTIAGDLSQDLIDIEKNFQKSLNASFEAYLEKQRRWAETSAVRDFEFLGDSILKELSHKRDSRKTSRSEKTQALATATSTRLKMANSKTTNLWKAIQHWMLPMHTDALGRRILLVPNPAFNDHSSASYDLMMGINQQEEERNKLDRLSENELSEIMRRNSEAFVPEPLDEDEYDLDEELDEEVADGLKQVVSEDKDDELEERKFNHADVKQDVQAEIEGHSQDKENTSLEISSNNSFHESVESEEPVGDAWARAFIWADGESIVARFEDVLWVSLQNILQGNLLLTTHHLYFRQIGEGKNVITKETFFPLEAERVSRFKLSKLTEIYGRRYLLRSQAVELFFVDCQEIFFNFIAGQKERSRFHAKIRNSCRTPLLSSIKSLNPRTAFKKSKLTSLWKKRQLSNFEYLMALNRMAGRTFNDISQYPVFPWVLADYCSDKLDLSDSRNYRDLTKPVGALNADRLALLLERYNELESFGFSAEEKFLYGSHYSSPGIVLHFLLRQEPFTSLAIDLQSGRFDCPDRLFFDIYECWKSCNTSTSDVKELIPEFFTMPEIFLNQNKFPLGKTQRGIVVDDVGLPPWAKGSAHEFVRLNRLALESDYVSENLHHWIDLVFGFKQRGQEAEAAHNVFHHLSYEGSVDLDKITDEIDRQAAESHIQNFGQTPSQLTNIPHPSRYGPEECWQPLINNMSTAVRLRCHTPSQAQQFGGKKGTGAAGAVLSIFIDKDAVTVLYADLKVGLYKWSPKSTKNRLRPEKLRTLQHRCLSRSDAVIKRGSILRQVPRPKNFQMIGSWSFAVVAGGQVAADKKRSIFMQSRLVSAKEALSTDTPPFLVSCGYWDYSIKAHSTTTWKVEDSQTGGHRGSINVVASDGSFLVTGGADCTCRVWIVNSPDLAIALSDGYTQTASGKSASSERILNCCRVLWGHETTITCLDLSSELDIVVSGCKGGRICVHTLRTGKFVRSFGPRFSSNASIVGIALEQHGRIVFQTDDLRLYTYTINGTYLCSVDAGETIHDMKITGEVLITGGENCHVYIRNLSTLKVLSGLDLSRHGPIRSINLTPEDLNPLPQHLFIGSDDGMISIVEHD